jgi:hypothetical protein
LNEWTGSMPIQELEGIDRSHAVSNGAAWYARLKASGKGVRVRSATTKSFYIGVESALPAVPGFIPPLKGLCIAPRGVEEGNDIELPAKVFSLASGDEVQFRLFSSTDRADDRAGDEVPDAEAYLQELDPVFATITRPSDEPAAPIPVTLHTRLTELGLLEITLQEMQGVDSWRLAFRTRTEHT